MHKLVVAALFLMSIGTYAGESSSNKMCTPYFSKEQKEKEGTQYLHQRNQNLHNSTPVQLTTARARTAGISLQKPAHRIENWLNYLEHLNERANKDSVILNRLKKAYYNLHVIKPSEIPQSYYDYQAKIARERGHGNIEITPRIKDENAKILTRDQQQALDNWIEYFVSSDSSVYPMWAKYWAFQGMLKLSKLNPETKVFGHRDRFTVTPFAELNREALAIVIDSVAKKLNKKSLDEIQDNDLLVLLNENGNGLNFGKLYSRALVLAKAGPSAEELLITKGHWVTYKQGTDHIPLFKSLQGKNTGWCTVGETVAQGQLSMGDFHVYYSNNQFGKPVFPRIAIRMEGTDIAEVRGIGADQNLDANIISSRILDRKLTEFGQEGLAYQKKSRDMLRLTAMENSVVKNQELSKDDLIFLYEIEGKIEGFGYKKDPRIQEIIEKRNAKKDLAFILNLKEHEISISESDALSGDKKYHHGELNLSLYLAIGDKTLPEYVNGDLALNNLTTNEGLTLPKHVKGTVFLGHITSLNNAVLPEVVNGDLDLANLREMVDSRLPTTVGGSTYLDRLAKIKNSTLPNTSKDINLGHAVYDEVVNSPNRPDAEIIKVERSY